MLIRLSEAQIEPNINATQIELYPNLKKKPKPLANTEFRSGGSELNCCTDVAGSVLLKPSCGQPACG